MGELLQGITAQSANLSRSAKFFLSPSSTSAKSDNISPLYNFKKIALNMLISAVLPDIILPPNIMALILAAPL